MKNLMLILLSLTTLSVFAEDVNIKGVDLKSEKATENRLSIKVDGNLSDNPQITINDKTLSIVIPNAHVATKIQRHFNDATTVTATQANRDSVSIKTTLPYSLQGKESLVNITLKDGSVDVSFPRVATSKVNTKISRSPSVTATSAATIAANAATAKNIEATNAEAEKLDENYLSTLVKENEKLAASNHPENARANLAKKTVQADTAATSDRVNLECKKIRLSLRLIKKSLLSRLFRLQLMLVSSLHF